MVSIYNQFLNNLSDQTKPFSFCGIFIQGQKMRNYIQEFEFEDMQLEDKIEVSFVNMLLWEINLKMENVIQLEILTVDNDR